MRRQVVALAGANTAALLVAVLAYMAYSRLLSPVQFALLSGAMTLARFGNLVLDGGIKTAIIKHDEEISAPVRRALFRGSLATALALTALLIIVMVTLHAFSGVSAESVGFLSAYACAYVLTYPFLFLHLADLERHRNFGPIATWESISIGLEYLLPLPFWLLFAHSFTTFVAAAWLARIVRVAGLRLTHNGASHLHAKASDWRGASAIFHEGWKFQVATAISMVRDNLHYLLVAPAFGIAWAGFYAWALQLANVSSQIFVQTASRIALPVLRLEKNDRSQWASTLIQIKWLAIFTLPIVAFLYHFAGIANTLFFSGRWTQALVIVLALSLRMIPGIATTSLSYLVLAQRGSKQYATGNLWWTASELVAGILALLAFGANGLACSYSLAAWTGVAVFARFTVGGSVRDVLSTTLFRPSLQISVLASIGVFLLQDWLGPLSKLFLCAALIVLAIIAEPDVRSLARGLVPRVAHEG